MTTKFRLIGKGAPPRRLGRYDVPNEVLDLQCDIDNIEHALELVRRVDHRNITQGGAELGRQMKWVTIRAMELWLRVARKIMARDYLAPDTGAERRRKARLR